MLTIIKMQAGPERISSEIRDRFANSHPEYAYLLKPSDSLGSFDDIAGSVRFWHMVHGISATQQAVVEDALLIENELRPVLETIKSKYAKRIFFHAVVERAASRAASELNVMNYFFVDRRALSTEETCQFYEGQMLQLKGVRREYGTVGLIRNDNGMFTMAVAIGSKTEKERCIFTATETYEPVTMLCLIGPL